MSIGLAESYELMMRAQISFERICDAVSVIGPDALSYLQGQCTQDLSQMSDGDVVDTLFLSPQGKLELIARVANLGEDHYMVVVDEGFGTELYERLRRFKLRIKADLAQSQVREVSVRGPAAVLPVSLPDGALFIAPYALAGLRGFDLVGESPRTPDGVVPGDIAALEIVRIESGEPKLGVELTEKTIPQEAGIVERTVSFTKGCFTGQELVARLDARGSNVPRRLRGLIFSPEASPSVGDEVLLGEKVVGTVTSVAHSPRLGTSIALGYLRREIEFPSTVEVRHDATVMSATAVTLPIAPFGEGD